MPSNEEINRAIAEWMGGHWHEVPESREWIPAKHFWQSGTWGPWLCIHCGERVRPYSIMRAGDIEEKGVSENKRAYTWDLNEIAKIEAKMIQTMGRERYRTALSNSVYAALPAKCDDRLAGEAEFQLLVATATALDRATAVFNLIGEGEK